MRRRIDDATFRALASEGHLASEIARAMGFDGSAVGLYARRHKIRVRSRSETVSEFCGKRFSVSPTAIARYEAQRVAGIPQHISAGV